MKKEKVLNAAAGHRAMPNDTLIFDNSPPDNKFLFGCVLCFVALGLFNILHHVMWRDELEAWMMARDASSLSELFNNIKYQGHPALWFVTLYALSRLTPNPLIMQIFHLALAVGTVYVALRSAPFTKLQKILFIFGYYPFFEYCVISRNYAFGLLLLLIFMSMFRPGFRPGVKKKYIHLSIVLFILCQTNPYGAVIAIALALTLLFELIFFKDTASPISTKTKWQFAAGAIIFAFGLLVSAAQMHPPHDSVWYHPTFLHDNKLVMLTKFLEAVAFIWRAYVPIPMFNMHFWGHNFISHLFADPVNAVKATVVLSIILLIFSLTLFLRRRLALFYYTVGTFGIVLFSYAIYGGSIRHWGHYFIVFVSAVWLSNLYAAKPFNSGNSGVLNKICEFKICKFIEDKRGAIFTAFLVVNVIAAVTANTLNYLYPFSANRETATFIKDNGLDKMPILGDKDYAVSGVAAYLNRPIYYPVTQRHATFIIWDNKREGVNASNILKYAGQYLLMEKQDILLVLTYPPSKDSLAMYNNVSFIKAFENSTLYEERFLLFIMKYIKHEPH
ncbi:MAG: hypothetical protein HQK98_02975 [Nitrospirae bacterium]|nr:hypothetical protein [Nitrospirota bacterium]